MRKIKNPYVSLKDYCCFGCSPDNHDGLRMDFYEDGDEIVSEWTPSSQFQGYINVLHGGIQATLMDEIACWVVLIKLKTGGVTSRIDVTLRKPVYLNKGKITLRASLVDHNKRIANVSVKLLDSDNKICVKGNIYYYTFPHEESIEKLCYPADYSTFFED